MDKKTKNTFYFKYIDLWALLRTFFFLFVCERWVLLQTGLYITSCNPKYFKRLTKLATYLFNQEKWLLDGGLKLSLLNCFFIFQIFSNKYLNLITFNQLQYFQQWPFWSMHPSRKPLEFGQFLKHQESYLKEHKSCCCFCTIFKCNNFLQSTFDYPKILQLHEKSSHRSWKQTL